MLLNTDYLKIFEFKVQEELVKLSSFYGFLDGKLLSCDDIEQQWEVFAAEYMSDAVPEIPKYPVVSLAWAMFLGMAVACGWDEDWERCSSMKYKDYYGTMGFDDMDEHIVRDLLHIPLDSLTAKNLENIVRRCGETAISYIRNEHIEPSTPMAFHIYARSVRVMYRVGAAIQLKKMNYYMEGLS